MEDLAEKALTLLFQSTPGCHAGRLSRSGKAKSVFHIVSIHARLSRRAPQALLPKAATVGVVSIHARLSRRAPRSFTRHPSSIIGVSIHARLSRRAPRGAPQEKIGIVIVSI